MGINFPNSPTVGQLYPSPPVVGEPVYRWDGEKWSTQSLQAKQPVYVDGTAAMQAQLTLIGDPVNPTDAADKHYVDTKTLPILTGPPAVLSIQVFTASGTYTPTPGMAACVVECVGGGGGGAGVIGAGVANQAIMGAGAGAGGYSRKYLTSAQVGTSQVVTVGAAGPGQNYGSGGAGTGQGVTGGGASSFGSLCIANGAQAVGGVAWWQAGPGGPVSGGVGDIVAAGPPGGEGGQYSTASGGGYSGGYGGSSQMGGGAPTVTYNLPASAGNNARVYGSGGGGGVITGTANGAVGGAGSPGIVIITEYSAGQGPQGPAGPPGVMRSYLAGLTLSTPGGSANFTVAAGVAADTTNAVAMTLNSQMTKTIAAWSVGNNGGCLDTGAIANNTWYHVHLIERLDTQVVDVLISLSATAPTLPANYTLFRRIGAMKTNASGQWTLFHQLGDEFLWDTPAGDAGSLNVQTTPVNVTLSVPTGVNIDAQMIVAGYNSSSATPVLLLFYSPIGSAQVPNTPLGNFTIFPQTNVAVTATIQIATTTGQVVAVSNLASANNTVFIVTKGYIDRRGRDA